MYAKVLSMDRTVLWLEVNVVNAATRRLVHSLSDFNSLFLGLPVLLLHAEH